MNRRMIRSRIGYWMRKYADRIDDHGAPRAMSYTFTFEDGEGIRFRQDGKGCKLWYYGMDDYEKAHDEADNEPYRSPGVREAMDFYRAARMR